MPQAEQNPVSFFVWGKLNNSIISSFFIQPNNNTDKIEASGFFALRQHSVLCATMRKVSLKDQSAHRPFMEFLEWGVKKLNLSSRLGCLWLPRSKDHSRFPTESAVCSFWHNFRAKLHPLRDALVALHPFSTLSHCISTHIWSDLSCQLRKNGGSMMQPTSSYR